MRQWLDEYFKQYGYFTYTTKNSVSSNISLLFLSFSQRKEIWTESLRISSTTSSHCCVRRSSRRAAHWPAVCWPCITPLATTVWCAATCMCWTRTPWSSPPAPSCSSSTSPPSRTRTSLHPYRSKEFNGSGQWNFGQHVELITSNIFVNVERSWPAKVLRRQTSGSSKFWS